MSTIFIAVQCCECSTMQVKQQKKSSNKWVCVICNQKQSVRKVFARGSLARDVRKFVQAFNISRQNTETLKLPSPLLLPEESNSCSQTPSRSFSKKRMDWSEYLDCEEEEAAAKEEGSGFGAEIEIVTELPKAMFKKPRLDRKNNDKNQGSNQLLKPVFSKKKERPMLPDQGNNELKEYPKKMAKQVSKWSEYMETEDDEMFETERSFTNPYISWCVEGDLQSQFNDQRVEEDIHPDFM